MDSELSQAIGEYAAANHEIKLPKPDEAESLRVQVARRFGFSDAHTWWSEHVPAPARTVVYSAGQGLQLLSAIIPAESGRILLFVTDDDPPPWACISGSRQALICLLGELRFFEFFMVDDRMNWIIFDTHHNTLVGHGESLTFPAGAP